MSSDASEQKTPPEDPTEPAPPVNPKPEEESPGSPPRRRILIGSQRDPAAYRPKPKRDWVSLRERRRGRDRREGGNPPKEGKAPDTAGEVPQQLQGAPLARPAGPVGETVAPPSVTPEVGAPAAGAEVSAAAGGGGAAAAIAAPPSIAEAPAPPTEPPVARPVGASPVSAPVASPTIAPVASPTIAPRAAATRAGARDEAEVEPEGRGERRRRGGRGDRERRKASLTEEVLKSLAETAGVRKLPRPSVRDRLSPELEEEFEQAVADVPLDSLMAEGESIAREGPLEPESHHTARVVAVQRDEVFVELGGKDQGTLPVGHFPEPPQVGATFEVVVSRFNAEDGLYELTLPGMAIEVGDWSQVAEGMLVEARVTGHNTGGLECEVNRIRGFIPVSQISLYRVENLAELVDQKFNCLVTEANPGRKNLVLSRRAVLEREREEVRKALLESLAPGQIHEGVVRRLMDFGAFIDLGGVDGLLHVSQMGWGRIGHPREVFQEGQTIRVRIERVDQDTGKISLGYRDMLESPWTNADGKYLINTVVRGRVVKIMDFGAFVELEPGVEGLVHISELSYKRVGRVSDVVKEGEEVDVMVLSVDTQAQRISLSMKAALRPPEPEGPPETAAGATQPPPPPPKPKRQPERPLKGGLGRSPHGKQSGLKW
jgi:predicted RNA-binding protein with RPS1 domain